MPVRVAINGFGRIGRTTFKAAFGKMKDLEFVAINDLTDTATLAHLLRHDTMYGAYSRKVTHTPTHLTVDGQKIRVYAERDPKMLPWKAEDVDIVLECTGRFVTSELAGQHIEAGAKHVIISAPAKGGDVPTHVMGVEDGGGKYAAKVTNNASCTTNCIAPVAALIEKHFGVKRALMTTIHSYTADQSLQDGPHKDLRRARAAGMNMVPTSTGAAIAAAQVVPQLEGVFDGLSIRVPTAVVSLSDLTFLVKKKTTIEEVNAMFRKEAKDPKWKGILDVTDEPLVSSDFIGNPNSSIVDLELTNVVGGDFVKVVAWYDNEWGYSNRLAEMAVMIGKSVRSKKAAR
jgi:glyceraldehyde 3-phosphate dehydrogenase